MKKHCILLSLLLIQITANAFKGEAVIDGINYFIITDAQLAEVRKKPLNYSGDIVIPSSIEYEGVICNVTSIGENAFESCYYLTSVVIPNSVTSIGNFAFQGCLGLSSIIIPQSITSIGLSAFDGCSSLSSFVIPYQVTSIANWTFFGCEKLLSITIGDNVTSIGTYSFGSCSSLSTVIIPNSVTSISRYAFANCSSLNSLTIGSGMSSIGSKAFTNCSDLTNVYCYAETVPNTDLNVFDGSHIEYATLYVPESSVNDYKVAAPWSKFGKIIALTNNSSGFYPSTNSETLDNDYYYTTSGIRVKQPTKGVYIRRGKKVLCNKH